MAGPLGFKFRKFLGMLRFFFQFSVILWNFPVISFMTVFEQRTFSILYVGIICGKSVPEKVKMASKKWNSARTHFSEIEVLIIESGLLY